MRADVAAYLVTVRDAAALLDRDLELLGTLTCDEAVHVMCAHRELLAAVRMIDDEVKNGLVATDPPYRFVVEHVGEVEVPRSIKRTKWQLDDLLAAVLARVNDDPTLRFDADGDRVPDAVLMARVAARLRECVSMSAGKVTGLRALGLEPSEFCNEELQGRTVRLPGRGL